MKEEFLKVGHRIYCKQNYENNITAGRNYIITMISACIYFKDNDGKQVGFPIRYEGDPEYVDGVKIAYFDLFFYSTLELRSLKLKQLIRK